MVGEKSSLASGTDCGWRMADVTYEYALYDVRKKHASMGKCELDDLQLSIATLSKRYNNITLNFLISSLNHARGHP